jgi:hypothetical protein
MVPGLVVVGLGGTTGCGDLCRPVLVLPQPGHGPLCEQGEQLFSLQPAK